MTDLNLSRNIADLGLLKATQTNFNAPTKTSNTEDRLREAANAFEGLFLQQMLKTARQASLGEGLLSSSAVESTQDLFDMEITKSASNSSALGISDAIYRQLSPLVTQKG